MQKVSFLYSSDRNTCFFERKAGSESLKELVSVIVCRAGAGNPCVEDHSNLLFYPMWKNNEGHTEGSGKAISTVSDLWPIQCSVHAVIGGIIYPTEALRSL